MAKGRNQRDKKEGAVFAYTSQSLSFGKDAVTPPAFEITELVKKKTHLMGQGGDTLADHDQTKPGKAFPMTARGG